MEESNLFLLTRNIIDCYGKPGQFPSYEVNSLPKEEAQELQRHCQNILEWRWSCTILALLDEQVSSIPEYPSDFPQATIDLRHLLRGTTGLAVAVLVAALVGAMLATILTTKKKSKPSKEACFQEDEFLNETAFIDQEKESDLDFDNFWK